MGYSEFEIADFVADASFIQWVVDNDPEATLFWEAYRMNNPKVELKIHKARLLLLNLRRAEETLYMPAEVENTWLKIQTKINRPPSKTFTPLMKIVASVSMIVIVSAVWYGLSGGYFLRNDSFTEIMHANQDDDFIEEVNTTGNIIRLHLSDGSIVSLENNSRLKYHKDHKGKQFREVYLTGEAFFDIAKNPHQPFFVYANEVVTKVLGTSFRIKAYDYEKDVLVSVKTGTVSVYSERRERKKQNPVELEVNGVVLMPNQQVLYQRTDHSFNKTLVDTPEIIIGAALQHNFDFDNTPLKEVLAVLQEVYGVEMIFDEEVMRNCYLTAPLGDEPLFEKLKIICRTIGASYELIDAKIVISSEGCK